MKRIAYSLFLIALLSCGSKPSSSTNRIVIQFRDSVIKDYYLLSLREHSVVVTPYTNDYSSVDTLVAQAQVVSFEKIEKLYRKSTPTLSDELWFGGAGCALGGFTSASVYVFADRRKFDFSSPLIGLSTGLLVGLLVNASYEELYLDTPEHLLVTRRRALYRDEEPIELQKIK